MVQDVSDGGTFASATLAKEHHRWVIGQVVPAAQPLVHRTSYGVNGFGTTNNTAVWSCVSDIFFLRRCAFLFLLLFFLFFLFFAATTGAHVV